MQRSFLYSSDCSQTPLTIINNKEKMKHETHLLIKMKNLCIVINRTQSNHDNDKICKTLKNLHFKDARSVICNAP